jgi:penicillin-binding protein 2
MPEALALKDHSGESRVFLERVAIGFAFFVFLTLLLVARLFYLQIIQHDVYATLSDKNRISVEAVPPVRGLIYDRNGELIADNVPSLNLTITIELVDNLDQTLAKIDDLIGLSEDEIAAFYRRLKRQHRPYEPISVLFKLSAEEHARIAVNEYSIPGVQVAAKLVRHYPKGALMAHAVGSVRRINEADARRLDSVAYSGTNHIGKIGVEKYYENLLLGKVGYQRVESNARGVVMQEIDSLDPVPGKNLKLHVDSSLQAAASAALGNRRGTIVAIEPATGGILALVSKPSYDPNLFVTGIDHATYAELRDSPDVPLFNRAVQGQYEPGSTIKPFLGLAGLVTGIVNADYHITDPGWYQLPNEERLYRDWNWDASGLGGHGEVNLDKAIYRSCNVYFYNLAVKLGIDHIHDHLTLFGFGKNTALDLPEARSGLLPSAQWKRESRRLPWYPGDTVNIGIGQGDMLVTPLQLVTAVALLANRGQWRAPRMLMEGDVIVNSRSNMKDVDLVPQFVWDSIISAMEKVVHRGNHGFGENGTAWAYIGQDIPYRMAGKSGTAQVVGIRQGEEYDEEELTERQRKHAWFVAFAPIDNPQIALAVLIENGGGGSAIAAPVARQVIDHYLEGIQTNQVSQR